MADQAAEKSLQATPRKLQQARDKGRVPRSQELSAVTSLLTLIAALSLLSSFLLNRLSTAITEGLMGQTAVFASHQAFVQFFNETIMEVLALSFPFMSLLMVAGIGGTLLLGGLAFSMESLRFRPEAINPAENMKNLGMLRSVVKLGLSILKIGAVSLIVWLYLRDRMGDLALLRWTSTGEMLSQIGRLILGLCLRVAVALIAIALLDALYQHWKFMQDMRMSFQEVKQEHKDTEGSPEVRGRIRRIRAQMLQEAMRDAVPKADVVLVNPTHYAVALKYDPATMAAPVLLAKGVDHKAEVIREIARAYGVPVMRRPELTRTIHGTVDVGKTVPEGLYMAVAEVLAVIYRLRQQKAKR